MSPHYNGIDTTPTLKQILLHFGYLIPFFEGERWIRNIYWTLAIEFQYYITIGLLFPLIESKRIIVRVIVYISFIAAPLISGIAFLPHYLPVFLLGILLFLYKTRVIKDLEFYIVSFLACLSILWFHNAATLCFSFATYIVILKFQNFKSRIGDFLGRISYSLYLFHGIVGMTFLNYIVHITNSGVIKFLCLIAALIITIIFSYLVFRFVEQPSKKMSSAIRYKKRTK
jgi:peptidoglycan/LPS O-acetylase OafA/YrhL